MSGVLFFLSSVSFDIFHSFVGHVLIFGVFNVLTVLTVLTGAGLFLVIFLESFDRFQSFSGRGLFYVICFFRRIR